MGTPIGNVPLGALALLAVLIVAAVGLWLTFTLMHMLLTLAVAGLVGWLADLAVPGQLPYGWLGAVAAGLAAAVELLGKSAARRSQPPH